MPGLLDFLLAPQVGGGGGLLQHIGEVIDARNRFRGLLHSPDMLQQQQMMQQLQPLGGGTMVRQPTDMEKYNRALLEQSAGFKGLPKELVDKITFWAAKIGAPPDMHLNALTDAANIKAARRAWESYSPESYAAGIMPPAMQFPKGDPRNAPIPPQE